MKPLSTKTNLSNSTADLFHFFRICTRLFFLPHPTCVLLIQVQEAVAGRPVIRVARHKAHSPSHPTMLCPSLPGMNMSMSICDASRPLLFGEVARWGVSRVFTPLVIAYPERPFPRPRTMNFCFFRRSLTLCSHEAVSHPVRRSSRAARSDCCEHPPCGRPLQRGYQGEQGACLVPGRCNDVAAVMSWFVPGRRFLFPFGTLRLQCSICCCSYH